MRMTIFGESHGEAIGVVLEGVPAGLELDLARVEKEMARRKPGQNAWSSSRKEADQVRIISGFYQGYTTGTPLCGLIYNQDMRSGDYASFKAVPRPGHADYTARIRYQGFADGRGGGHFSGRLTAPYVFAGALAKQLLAEKNIYIGAHILNIAGIEEEAFTSKQINRETFEYLAGSDFPVLQAEKKAAMQEAIRAAKAEQDSVGGVIECAADGLPAGLGSPGMDSLEGILARYCFAIPAVKGIDFGAGFGFCAMRGSAANDPLRLENGKVVTATNHNGGINGGITNGMPVIFRVVIKPTASIGREQTTLDLDTGQLTGLTIPGRHDPCIVPRAVPVVEAAAGMALCELLFPPDGNTGSFS